MHAQCACSGSRQWPTTDATCAANTSSRLAAPRRCPSHATCCTHSDGVAHATLQQLHLQHALRCPLHAYTACSRRAAPATDVAVRNAARQQAAESSLEPRRTNASLTDEQCVAALVTWTLSTVRPARTAVTQTGEDDGVEQLDASACNTTNVSVRHMRSWRMAASYRGTIAADATVALRMCAHASGYAVYGSDHKPMDLTARRRPCPRDARRMCGS